MKKKQITKLFAVMAIAASPAAANPAARPDPWAVAAPASQLSPEETGAAMSAMIEIGFAAIARPAPPPVPVVARPRTTPSGAPACGNVASRAPRRECAVPAPAILADAPAPAPTATAMPTAARAATAGGTRPRAIRPTTLGAK